MAGSAIIPSQAESTCSGQCAYPSDLDCQDMLQCRSDKVPAKCAYPSDLDFAPAANATPVIHFHQHPKQLFVFRPVRISQ